MFKKIKQFFIKNETLSLVLMVSAIICIPILIVFLLRSITKESFDYNPHKELIFFSMPGCGHCKNFKPTWDLLEQNYGDIKEIKLIQVSSNEKPELVEKFEIEGFPTILYVKDNRKVSEYKGDRTYNDLEKFMKHCMSS
jgi:thiol-disulfide isomerase/thioredoxin